MSASTDADLSGSFICRFGNWKLNRCRKLHVTAFKIVQPPSFLRRNLAILKRCSDRLQSKFFASKLLWFYHLSFMKLLVRMFKFPLEMEKCDLAWILQWDANQTCFAFCLNAVKEPFSAWKWLKAWCCAVTISLQDVKPQAKFSKSSPKKR